MTRVILFDFDGVLADTEEPMLRFSEIACAELGYPCQPNRAHLEASEPMSFANLGRQLGLPDSLVPAYVQRSLELFSQVQAPLKIFPGMDDVLTEVSKKARVGIVSGNTSQTIEKFLQDYRLDHTVQLVLGVNAPGTKAVKIKQMLGSLGSPDNAAFVGDTTSDVLAAREAAISIVAVSWGHHSRQKLVEARPDYIVDTPKELLPILLQSR